jgi:hypothetical protein
MTGSSQPSDPDRLDVPPRFCPSRQCPCLVAQMAPLRHSVEPRAPEQSGYLPILVLAGERKKHREYYSSQMGLSLLGVKVPHGNLLARFDAETVVEILLS